MRRYALRDDQWDRIKDLLPGREGHVGVTAANNRLFVEAVLYRYRAGIPWRDLPERFGDWKNVHRRFSRWAAFNLRGARLLDADSLMRYRHNWTHATSNAPVFREPCDKAAVGPVEG